LIPDNAWWTGRFLRMSGDKSSREESTEESQQHPGAFGNFLPQRVFTSFDSLGTYNATRILQCVPLTFSDAGEHTATPNCKARMIPATDQEAPNADGESDAAGNSTLWLAGYSDPFRGGGHPPFWLNAIGRGGFWPVDLLDRYLVDTGSERTSSLMDIAAGNSSRHHDSIPTGMFDKWSRKPLSARLAAACLLALFVLFGLILCTFARLERWPQYFFGIKGTNSERRAWIVLVNILAFSWIARLLILDLPAGRFFEDPINWGLLALEAVLLLFASWVIGRALNDGQRPFWAWSIVFLTAASQVAFACIKPGERVAEIFYLYRSEYLFNGVSPVVPFIFLCIAVICLVSRHIYSLVIFSPLLKPRMPCYAGEGSPEILRSVSRSAVQDILQACYSPWRMLASKIFPRRRRASRPEKKSANAPAPKVSRLTAWLLLPTLLLFLIGARILFPQGLQTFETEAYGTLLTLCSVALMIFLLCEITWVALMWFCLQRGLLNPLERTTLRVCFSRVSGFSWRHLWFSFDLSPAVRFRPLFRAYESVLRIEKLRAVEIESDGRKEDESDADNAGEKNSEEREGLDQSIGLVTEQYTELMKNLEPNSRVRAFSKFEVALCRCATQVIRHILSGEERCKGSLGTSLDVTAKEIDQVLKDSQKDDPLGANAEELVGLIYIYAIQHVLMDIRSHILAFTFGYFFLLLALTVYPVGPHHSIMVLLILFFAALAIVVVTIFSQMHRDAILSRTTSTEPGKLDAGFYQKLISVLGVPLIGLLASQFPEISNFLFSWLEPSLQTLK
ncbi:MAG TPA: hypothetical protein VK670_04075, partial [Silvibacterium sp.]|nr:hypothetical protein [Silvibacterium sp.]